MASRVQHQESVQALPELLTIMRYALRALRGVLIVWVLFRAHTASLLASLDLRHDRDVVLLAARINVLAKLLFGQRHRRRLEPAHKSSRASTARSAHARRNYVYLTGPINTP